MELIVSRAHLAEGNQRLSFEEIEFQHFAFDQDFHDAERVIFLDGVKSKILKVNKAGNPFRSLQQPKKFVMPEPCPHCGRPITHCACHDIDWDQ